MYKKRVEGTRNYVNLAIDFIIKNTCVLYLNT